MYTEAAFGIKLVLIILVLLWHNDSDSEDFISQCSLSFSFLVSNLTDLELFVGERDG